MWLTSPFFGINLINAVLKVSVRVPLLLQTVKYSSNGIRKKVQNFSMKRLPRVAVALGHGLVELLHRDVRLQGDPLVLGKLAAHHSWMVH